MIAKSKHISANQIQSLSDTFIQKDRQGIVYDVVLDESNPAIQKTSSLISYIGGIQFRLLDDIATNDTNLAYALPLDCSEINLPTKNEIVEIYYFAGMYYYRRIGSRISINTTADINSISGFYTPKKNNRSSSEEYRNVSTTGITRSGGSEDRNYETLGDYFKEQTNIHRLRLYEGDHIIESRFGQSIRFSAYNNNQKSFSPTILIRNRENQISLNRDLDVTTEENLMADGSVIAMVSNQFELDFVPGVSSESGNSDFETKPVSFKKYPNRFIGDQLLLNSGRIIISAKDSEMIFFSKKNYGFISDGGLSIDNRLGIDIRVGSDINITSNSYDIKFNTDKGKIHLGNGKLEPVVKGDTMVSLLKRLIDLINNQIFLTPAGPTSSGPQNRTEFIQLKEELVKSLSSQVKTI